MASKRITMKRRRVVKKGKSRRVRKSVRRSRRHRGGGELTDEEKKALNTIRNIRIQGLEKKIEEQNHIIQSVSDVYANVNRNSYLSDDESKALDSKSDNAEAEIKRLQAEIDKLKKALI